MGRAVVGLAILMGIVLGGRIEELADVKIARLPFIVASLVLKYSAVFVSGRITPTRSICLAVSCCSYGMLFYGLWPNIRQKGLALILFGSVTNFAAIVANGGRMPVDTGLLDPVKSAAQIAGLANSLTHQAMTHSVRLRFLGDIFSLRLFSEVPTTFSIGDVVMAVGLCVFVLHTMVYSRKERPDGTIS